MTSDSEIDLSGTLTETVSERGEAASDRAPIGYVELLAGNTEYRRLWYSHSISSFGDWFNHVAIMVLLLELTGSGIVMGLAMIARFLPFFLLSPVAGVVADRYNRRTIMIVTDLLRGVVVLGFLLIDQAGEVWLVYCLIAIQLSLSAFFEPARNAVMPTITTRRELLAANVLSGMTWSLMLAVGGLLGGLVVHTLGRPWAFVIDSCTYFLSAGFILRMAVPHVQRRVRHVNWQSLTGLTDMMEGLRYILARRGIRWLISIKTLSGLSSGAALLLIVMGERTFPIGDSASLSVGILFGAWGIGAIIGPLIARVMTRESPRAMRRSIGICLLVRAVFLALFGMATNLWLACVFAIGYMAAGSTLWVFSGTLLQMSVPSEFRGRVFAAEWALFTLIMCISNISVGWGLDVPQWSPMFMAGMLAIIMVPPGLIWLFLALRRDAIFEKEHIH